MTELKIAQAILLAHKMHENSWNEDAATRAIKECSGELPECFYVRSIRWCVLSALHQTSCDISIEFVITLLLERYEKDVVAKANNIIDKYKDR